MNSIPIIVIIQDLLLVEALDIITLTQTCFNNTHTPQLPGIIEPMLLYTAQRTSQSHSHLIMPGTQLWLTEPIP
jgi:hypothetical protein